MSGAISIFCGCSALCLVYAIMVFLKKSDFMQDHFNMAATQQQTKTLKLFFCLAVTSLFCFANMISSISIALNFCLIKAHIH